MKLLASFVFSMVFIATASAFEGTKSIFLQGRDGSMLDIGDIEFTPKGDASQYKISFNETVFGDYFLSMRPFRCHAGERIYCRQQYPYPLERVVSANELRALEYDLMFIVKTPQEYGIDPYNGRYFVMQTENNGDIRGSAHGVDLNSIAAPPAAGVIYPITAGDLDDLEASSEVFPHLVIR